ncbi:MAG TPA: hypothetical protein VJ927_09795 [Actinomycetota bacterium]|nr:hypothetical protein [Actinomycetota bacterium]
MNDQVWRTVVTRPSDFDQDRDGIPLATGWAICASTPNAPPDVEVVASPVVMASSSPTLETATTSVTCPEGSTMTAGGFRVIPAADDRWEVAGLYNAWVWDSAPADGASWSATLRRIAGQQGPTPPSLRAYALCAQTPISSNRLVEVDTEKREPINFVYWDGQAECDADEVASGGGYTFTGEALVPHLVATSKPVVADGTWTIAAINGHQTGAAAGVSLAAVCIDVPVIVDVNILSPRGEICGTCTVDVEYPFVAGLDPSDPSMSEPIDFAAAATDGSGDPLTGDALEWTSYVDPAGSGTPLGTGESFTARLPAPPPGQSVGYVIEVVASDAAGNTGSDFVVVMVVAGS